MVTTADVLSYASRLLDKDLRVAVHLFETILIDISKLNTVLPLSICV
jgi:hypothetical protein